MKKRNRSTKNITTDNLTLKRLVAEGANSWLHKILSVLLAGNITLMVSIGWGIIKDHFVLQQNVAIVSDHTEKIKEHDKRIMNVETKTSTEDVRISNLEQQKQK